MAAVVGGSEIIRAGGSLPRSSAPIAVGMKVYHELLKLYSDGSSYGGLSQMAHACQAASLASQAGYDDATVVTALLHDIGWKLAGAAPFKIDAAAAAGDVPPPKRRKLRRERRAEVDNVAAALLGKGHESMAGKLGILSTCSEKGASAEQQRAQHDTIGATFLRMRGFCEKVPHLVEGHVLAKRYLCFKEAGYYSKLSAGSKRTLVFQGGPMTEAEAGIFESDPLFELSKQMRRWDEEAKYVGLDVPEFSSYKDRILRCITEHSKSAEETLKTSFYVRRGNTITALRSIGTCDKKECPPLISDRYAYAQGDAKECDCEALVDQRVFKNFKTACRHYAFPGSHQVGSYGPRGTGIVRTYSNATPGKDIVLDKGGVMLYRLKAKVRAQFEVNMRRKKPVRVFRKVSTGVVDLGEFKVEGFVPAGQGDQVDKFGTTFVRFVKVL